MQTGGDGCIHEALAVDPGNPLIQIALAGLKDYAEQAEFLREYGVKHLPADAAVCREAAGMLRAQHDEARAKRADAAAEKAAAHK